MCMTMMRSERWDTKPLWDFMATVLLEHSPPGCCAQLRQREGETKRGKVASEFDSH